MRFKLAPGLVYIAKKCTCGRIFTHLPHSTRIMKDDSPMSGAYFECICKSTNFIKFSDLPRNLELIEVKAVA